MHTFYEPSTPQGDKDTEMGLEQLFTSRSSQSSGL